MAEGSLICKGKSNTEWNYSAPHGAGRVLSRKKAQNLDMKEYKKKMKGIYTSCVSEDTLDESPMAYKNSADIIKNIKDTVKIIDKIKPVYNFKAEEKAWYKKKKQNIEEVKNDQFKLFNRIGGFNADIRDCGQHRAEESIKQYGLSDARLKNGKVV